VVFINVEVDSVLSEKYDFESSSDAMQQAEEIWAENRAGPLTHHNGTVWGAFVKLPDLEASHEFKALDAETQKFMLAPTVPAFEFAMSAPMLPPMHKPSPGNAYLSAVVFLMNPQSRGQVSLSSANPTDSVLIDPGYMTHVFDEKAMLDAIKETMNFFQNSAVGEYFRNYILAPKSVSDEHIIVCYNHLDLRVDIKLLNSA
jgi:choline dehydrogenase-like flavoprotein